MASINRRILQKGDQSRFIDLALRDLAASNEFDMDWLKADERK
jgi:hypothetical protein